MCGQRKRFLLERCERVSEKVNMMTLDIETLRLIWWVLLGVLFIGFAITDGFDLGVAALLPFVAKNETERHVVLNTIGPFWEGNQVWIILGAGAIFAAWPYVYAVAFSGFYLLILLLLLTLGISRPVSFKYRNKLSSLFWRHTWDWIVFVGGVAPALIFGILIGNILTGIPFYFDETLRMHYTGDFFSLFSPFAWWCGLTSLTMLSMHGGIYIAIKTENPIYTRAVLATRLAACALMVLFTLGGVWIATAVMGYEVIGEINPFGYSNPLHKNVGMKLGAWLQNYAIYQYAILAPIVGIAGAMGACLCVKRFSRVAFVCSSVSMAGIITTVGVSMFPFILPSSIHPTSSLLVWDASSGEFTLLLMLVSVAIFLPIILLYTSWVYHVLRGKVTKEMVENEDKKHGVY